MKRIAAFASLVIALTAMSQPVSYAEESMFGKITNDELLSLFLIRAVRTTDTGNLEPSATATFIKWDRPPRFRVLSDDDELAKFFTESVVRPFLKVFTASTNFTATVSIDDEQANVVTIIGEDPIADIETYSQELLQSMDGDRSELDQLKTLLEQNQGNCFHKTRVIDRTIVSAVVYVPKPNTAMFATAKCFGRSAAASLGMSGPDKETDTVRNRSDPAVSFTASDQAVLRILYDHRVPYTIKIEDLARIVDELNTEFSASP